MIKVHPLVDLFQTPSNHPLTVEMWSRMYFSFVFPQRHCAMTRSAFRGSQTAALPAQQKLIKRRFVCVSNGPVRDAKHQHMTDAPRPAESPSSPFNLASRVDFPFNVVRDRKLKTRLMDLPADCTPGRAINTSSRVETSPVAPPPAPPPSPSINSPVGGPS